MFCKQCGAEIADGASFCTECGAQQTAPQAAPQPQQPQQPNYGQAPQGAAQPQPIYGQPVPGAMPENPEYKTMGGWLLFFVILDILAILAAAASLASTSYALEALEFVGLGGLGTMYVVESLLVIALSIAFVVMVFTRKPHFLLIYQIQGIVSIVITIIEICMISGSYGAAYIDTASMITSTISSIVGLLLLTLYFCKSVRVRTYMGGTEYIDKAIIKFRP